MDSRGQSFAQSTHTSPRRSPDRQQQNFISPGSFHQYDDPSQASSIIPQPLPPTSNSWQQPMSSVQLPRRNSDFNQFAPNMVQEPSYAVSPRSLSPQQVYQSSRHGTSGLQEWDGSHRQTMQGHQPMAIAEEVPAQYRQQQPYQPYDYQPSYPTEQYAQYAVAAPVTSTPSSSSSSGSPQAAEQRAYPPSLPSLQYPQPQHYAPGNPEYLNRDNFIQSPEVGSSSYSGQVGHVGEWRGSTSQSQSVYSNQVTIDPPTSFPLRQVGAPAPIGFESGYAQARRSPPEPSAFRSPSPPRIAHEPVEPRHRSDSLDSRRPSVDAMTAGEQDLHSTGLPPQKPKRRRADAHQLRVLNEVYARTAFPSTEERIDLGRRLGMSPRQVQIWFQNRRQNAKAGRGPPLGTPSEYQHIPLHSGTPSAYREIAKAEQGEIVETRYGQPAPTYPGSRMITKPEYD